MGDLVGELGRAVLDEDGPEGWPEFLPYVLQSASAIMAASGNVANSDQPLLPQGVAQAGGGGGETGEASALVDRVVTGLRLMSSAAEHTAMAAAADPTAFRALVETLQRCLCWGEEQGGGAKGSSPDIRLEAVRALGSVIVSSARPSDQAAFSTCLPHLLLAIHGEQSRGGVPYNG